ncbi:hypothetical protein ABZ725_12670 [Streptomyces sp. NPDC006872]
MTAAPLTAAQSDKQLSVEGAREQFSDWPEAPEPAAAEAASQ